MVDIHCHVLPGVDDGAESIEESLQMLRRSAATGVDIVVATPHLLRGVYEIESVEREQITAELQKAADENEIKIQIKPGVEYYLSPQIMDDINRLKDFTINNNGKYILVELPMQTIPTCTEGIFSNLKMQGITPVLAHPERNVKICQDPNILFDFVKKDCVAQLNVGSILGYFGQRIKKVARVLLTHKLVHVIASDMHSARTPTLSQGVSVVSKLLGQERASHMFDETPRQIVAGETFYKEEPQRVTSERRWLKSILFGNRM